METELGEPITADEPMVPNGESDPFTDSGEWEFAGQETRTMYVELTAERSAELSGRMAETIRELTAAEAEKREEMRRLSDNCKALRKQLDKLADAVSLGAEEAPVVCRWERLDTTLRCIREDTGEVIQVRSMTDEERQQDLFFDPPAEIFEGGMMAVEQGSGEAEVVGGMDADDEASDKALVTTVVATVMEKGLAEAYIAVDEHLPNLSIMDNRTQSVFLIKSITDDGLVLELERISDGDPDSQFTMLLVERFRAGVADGTWHVVADITEQPTEADHEQ